MLRKDTVDRALQEIAKGYAQYQYFFDRLDSPSWLDALSRAGFFKKPPGPIPDGQYVRLPFWPESRYLARMAGIPEAQEIVLKIALAISHRLYVMGHGRIVFEGSPDELRRNEAVRREWLEV